MRRKAEAFDNEAATDEESLKSWVIGAVQATNNALLEYNKNEAEGYCTVTLLSFKDDLYVLANLGDSLAYLLSCDDMIEISRRHTMAMLKRLLWQTPTEAEEHMLRHYHGENNQSNSLTLYMKDGKIDIDGLFLVCSDGLDDGTPPIELARILRNVLSADEAVTKASEKTVRTTAPL